jgi:hypothetical protein
MIKHIDFNKFWEMLEAQHKDELIKYNITRKSLPQIMSSIAAMSVFPFVARGILEGIFESFGVDFDTYIEERKDFAPEFVLGALKSRITK